MPGGAHEIEPEPKMEGHQLQPWMVQRQNGDCAGAAIFFMLPG